jgi:hypothetical protein
VIKFIAWTSITPCIYYMNGKFVNGNPMSSRQYFFYDCLHIEKESTSNTNLKFDVYDSVILVHVFA